MVVAALILGDPHGPTSLGLVLFVLGAIVFLPGAIAQGVVWAHALLQD